MKIIKQSVELMDITCDPLSLIEVAGRVCYKSEDKITEDSSIAFAKRLLKSGHTAVLEFADATFKIVCDRGVSHELVRHRLASYCQESTRYVLYDKGLTFVCPAEIKEDEKAFLTWSGTCIKAGLDYRSLLAMGYSPQIARSVLPTCLKTEVMMKANFREWLHFIDLRTSPASHPQMQEVANMIKSVLARECPEIFGED